MSYIFAASGNNRFALFRENSRTCFSVILENSIRRIQEVVSDLSYEAIPLSRLAAILSQMQSRVVTLSDGSLKLYLQPRLLGGMLAADDSQNALALGIFDPSVSDKTVATNIARGLPPNTYSSVTVFTMKYAFWVEGEKDSRVVVLTPQGWAWFANILRNTFARKNRVIPVGNQVVSAVLGSKDPDDIRALEESFCRNQTVTVVLSLDRELFDVKITDSQITTGVARGAEGTYTLLESVVATTRKISVAAADKCVVS